MFEIVKSEEFSDWLGKLRDKALKSLVSKRIERLGMGNYGDFKSVGSGILEARIHYGAGYRIYFLEHEKTIVVLLYGGDKSSQKFDILKAIEIGQEWKNEQIF